MAALKYEGFDSSSRGYKSAHMLFLTADRDLREWFQNPAAEARSEFPPHK
jgi:hypothetical protein